MCNIKQPTYEQQCTKGHNTAALHRGAQVCNIKQPQNVSSIIQWAQVNSIAPRGTSVQYQATAKCEQHNTRDTRMQHCTEGHKCSISSNQQVSNNAPRDTRQSLCTEGHKCAISSNQRVSNNAPRNTRLQPCMEGTSVQYQATATCEQRCTKGHKSAALHRGAQVCNITRGAQDMSIAPRGTR